LELIARDLGHSCRLRRQGPGERAGCSGLKSVCRLGVWTSYSAFKCVCRLGRRKTEGRYKRKAVTG
jgi:hypothetical protein